MINKTGSGYIPLISSCESSHETSDFISQGISSFAEGLRVFQGFCIKALIR
jgi:hypothetical protein